MYDENLSLKVRDIYFLKRHQFNPTARASAAASTVKSESTLVSSNETSTKPETSGTPITFETAIIIHSSTKTNSHLTSPLSQSAISSHG